MLEPTYLFSIDYMSIINNLIHNRRISISYKAKTPWLSRVPIFHDNRIRNITVLPKVLVKRSYSSLKNNKTNKFKNLINNKTPTKPKPNQISIKAIKTHHMSCL